METSVSANKSFSANPHFSAKQLVWDSSEYRICCRKWSSLISLSPVVLIPHPLFNGYWPYWWT